MAKEQMKDLKSNLETQNSKAESAKEAAEKSRKHVDELAASAEAAKEGLDENLVAVLEKEKQAAIEGAKSDIAKDKTNQETAQKEAEKIKEKINDKIASNDNALSELGKLKSNIYGKKVEGSIKEIKANTAEGQNAMANSDTKMRDTATAIDQAGSDL